MGERKRAHRALTQSRQTMRSSKYLKLGLGFALPSFLGTYLTKMVFVEEQNKTFVKDREKEAHSEGEKEPSDSTRSKRLISFVRCRKVAEIIKELYLYQSQQYMLRAEPSILVGFDFILFWRVKN